MERCFRFIVGLFLMASLFSCNLSSIEEFQLGENFVDSNSGVVLIDTMIVNTSTVRFDSIITSGVSRLLMGGYKNLFTGTVTSNPNFEIASGSFTIVDTDLVYDSLVVRMNYDGYFIGDTMKLITINAKQLTKQLKLYTNSSYLYNTSSFQLADESLGEMRFYPHPNSKTDLNLRLSDKLGEKLFKDIMNKADTVSNTTYFKDFFKGLSLVSKENQNQAAVGFVKDSLSLRVYYHEVVKETESKRKTYFSFPFDASGVWFNQITHNAVGSLLGTIGQSKNVLPSNQTSDLTMIQPGIGIYTKIKIPGVSYLKGYGKNVAFIGSVIQITPLKDSYSETNPLPDSLSVYIADRKNQITSQLGYSTGYVYANKVVPADFDKLPYYEIDITPFFTSELAKSGISENSLLVGTVASQSGITINPIVFSGTDSNKEIVEMHVYCYLDKSK
ncbi:MAG: DUF4270 family protein [Bacteroidia bacterium]|nr:DUF4270 family protein [Bacteroidia bacterium]